MSTYVIDEELKEIKFLRVLKKKKKHCGIGHC
jgi:hypothetical protein